MKRKIVKASFYTVTDEAAKFLRDEAESRRYLYPARDCIAQIDEKGSLLGVIQMHGRYKVSVKPLDCLSAKPRHRSKFLLSFQNIAEQWN